MSIFKFNRQRHRVYGAIGKPPARPPLWKRLNWRRFLVWGVGLAALLFVVGTGVVAFVSRDLPDPNKLSERIISESTKIYDRTGAHLLYEVYQDQKRTVVPLAGISPRILQATVAIEDKHFYEHKGIRPISILRAAFNNLIGRQAGSGGASTLTQQLIKKTVVGDSRSIFRKIKEAILAIRLERKYSKDQILQLYLNEIPYGSTNYGVEAAAQTYFHTSAKEVTLAEAATLAAIINRPSYYLSNRDALRNRRDVVLRLMQTQGYITEEEKKEAQNHALRLYGGANLKDAPHFVLYVKQLLADQFGEAAVDTSGLKVITTLDYDKQKKAEEIIKIQGAKFAKEANADNAALVAIDPHNGQILALVGSRDYNNDAIDGQYDVAILGKRQPGSSLKPLVYTLAFQKGYTPETVVYDVKTDFDLRDGSAVYSPKNYDNKEHGLVTFRTALQRSLNIPAVKVSYLVGTTTIEFAKSFGYTTFGDSNLYGLSLVLGGAEVNLLEHTNGYATLAGGGVYHAPVAILKVTNDRGATLLEWKENDGTAAVTPEIAATITNVLADDAARTLTFGAHSTLTLPDRPVAAKTGTTNDNKDAWTLGYVPSLTAGVWVGNTTPQPMKAGGNKLAGVIWNQFMKAALASTTPEQFPIPPGNDAAKPTLRGHDGGIKLLINKLNGRIATSSTPDALIETRVYLPPHDILHYVTKDDPRGPLPANPTDDAQYLQWENALQAWVARQNATGTPVSLTEPPTEYDNGSSELAPTVEIIAPASGASLETRQLDIIVRATAPRGVTQVTYVIDGATIGSAAEFPFDFSYYATTLAPGAHSLKAIATDDQGNAGVQQITFNLTASYEVAGFDWVDASPLTLAVSSFPRPFYLTPYRWDDIKEIKIYVVNAGFADKWLYTFNHAEDQLVNNQLFFTWKKGPGPGEHTLKAVLTDTSGQTAEKSLSVEVR